jgi:hypothetical protein
MESNVYPINMGCSIMPTNLEELKKRRDLYMSEVTHGVFNPVESIFQGSISSSDAETSVVVRFLSDKKQMEAMLPPGKNLAITDNVLQKMYIGKIY